MWTFDGALGNARKKIRYKKYKDALYVLSNLEKIDPNDPIIQFEIARCLVNIDGCKDKGKELLLELLNSNNKSYAMFELAKFEIDQNNKEQAWIYFEDLLSTENNEYAILELGRLEMEQGNKEEAKKLFESLLGTSNSQYAMMELGKIEITDNNFEEATNYFDQIPQIDKVLLERIFLNIRSCNFEEAYNIFNSSSFSGIIELGQIKQIRNYLRYKLNLEVSLPDKYFYSQLLNYDEDLSLEHIKQHLDENGQKKIHTTFNKHININSVYEDMKQSISSNNPIRCTAVDKYIINYDYTVGEINNTSTNKLEIVTLSNSKNIITMYPIANIKENIKVKQKV